MESIMSGAGELFRYNIEDWSTTQSRVMSTGEKTMEPLEVKKFAFDLNQKFQRLSCVMSTGEKTTEAEKATKRAWAEYLTRLEASLREINEIPLQCLEEERKRRGKFIQSVADKIKAETQKLQQDTGSDPQVRQTAEFVQKMSEEILDQNDRLSGNKASVKDTCREVKIFLHQITDLAEDKWQSLSEEAKLKLESLIKNLWKMTASMWKLIFCVLLLSEMRDVFDILNRESCYISLSSGRLKYAFKMASMLALWMSHDVETNPGPQFNERACVEMYVRRLSLALRDDLDTAGSIWSGKTAKAAYNAGYSMNLRWNNPSSGKNKDSLPKLKERAKELIRLLSDRNCLPSDLPVFTDLDQQETLDRLRKYLKLQHLNTTLDDILNEPGFTPPFQETCRHLTQLAQEEISNFEQMMHNPPARPRSVSNINEFQQLADSQCLNKSEENDVDTPTDTCDITGDVSLPTNTSYEALMANIEPMLPSFTWDETYDVFLLKHTPDEVILSDSASGPSRVLNSNDANTSHRYTPNDSCSPYGETQSAVPAVPYDGGCEDDSTNASDPLQNVSPDNNQVDTACEGVYESQETFRTEATNTETHVTTEEGYTQTYVATTDTDTQASGTTAETRQTPRSHGTYSLNQASG